MKSKKYLIFAIMLFIFMFGAVGVLAVAEKTITITGSLSGYSSSVILRTDSDAAGGAAFDAYDMVAPSSPSDYSSFYSSITGKSLAIDSWSPAVRTLNLIFSPPTGFTGGAINFNWNNPGGDYKGTFKYYGATGGYTGTTVDRDMDSYSSYDNTITNDNDIYIQVIVADEEVITAPAGGGGAGGAGGGIPVLGKDIFIKNKYMDVYIGTKVVEGARLIKDRTIDIYNQANEPIQVILEIEGLEDILFINDEDLIFTLQPNERKIINAEIKAPRESGVYNGWIYVQGNVMQVINVMVVATEKELWFDAELVVDLPKNMLRAGDNLPAQLILQPQGLEVGFDVTATYTIKRIVDEEEIPTGIIKTKEFFVDGDYEEMLEFDTSGLEPGTYVLELELKYPNEVAISRSSFEVRGEPGFGLGALMNYKFILLLLGIGAFIILLLIILLMRRHKRIRR